MRKTIVVHVVPRTTTPTQGTTHQCKRKIAQPPTQEKYAQIPTDVSIFSEGNRKFMHLALDLPGFVPEEEIEVMLKENMLIVVAKRFNPLSSYVLRERPDVYRRVFTLPEGVVKEDIEVEYENGVFHIVIEMPVLHRRFVPIG